MQNMGWICPRCGNSNAPFVPSCQGCPPRAPVVHPSDIEQDAKNVGERLKRARLAKGFESATEAAKAFGWNENTYRSHENGVRGLKIRSARIYAETFSVEVEWLLGLSSEDSLQFDAERLRGRIEARLAELGKSIRGAAREVGLGESSIRNILDGRSKSPTVGTLKRLCKALDVDKDWFFEEKF